jgi:signal transduction histidine kinase
VTFGQPIAAQVLGGTRRSARFGFVLVAACDALLIATCGFLHLSGATLGTTIAIAGASVGLAYLSTLLPWERLGDEWLFAYPLAILASLVVLAASTSGVAGAYTGFITVAFIYVGLTQGRVRSLLVIPLAVLAWIYCQPNLAAATLVKLPIAVGVWILVGQVVAIRTERNRDETARLAAIAEHQHKLVDELQELDQAKSDFISTVSHELRTPLTSISGYLEMLTEGDAGPVSPDQLHMLDIVSRNAARLRALVDGLLTLSRIESGAYRLEKAPVELRDVLESVVATISPVARAKQVQVVQDLAASLIVDGDANDLERVVLNLVSNAVKFTPAGGIVTILSRQDDADAEISVSDNGIGIPKADQERLFARFFRASNATERAISGTGLGLTIAQTIVNRHGGSIDVHSELGVGSTFVVRIPLGVTAAQRAPQLRRTSSAS